MNTNGLSLESLFRTCDVNNTGFICREELRELCSGFGISADDADSIFDDLDYDRDSKIDFQDFCKGFKDFIPQESFTMNSNFKRQSLGRSNLKGSKRVPYQGSSHLYGQEQSDVSATFESMLNSVMNDIQVLQEENIKLKEQQEKEKMEHAQQIKALEKGIDEQVAKVEERVRMETIDKTKRDRKMLKMQMDQEMNELQAHMQLFEKVDDWLTRRQSRSVAEDPKAVLKTVDLQSDVLGLTNKLDNVKADVDKLKTFYDDKADSNSAHSSAGDEASQECMLKQYRLLHDTNERMKFRKESLKKMVVHEDPEALPHLSDTPRGPRISPMYGRSDSTSSELTGKKYVLRRLLNDVDSGISTTQDNDLELSAQKSRNEEMNLNSGDFSLVSYESGSRVSTTEKNAEDDTDASLLDEPLVQDNQFFVREFPYSSMRKKRLTSANRRSFRSRKSTMSTTGTSCPPDRTYKVVFAGDAAVGKTSFILRICEDVGTRWENHCLAAMGHCWAREI